jgi:long-chain acyl-CoA synthetase
VLNEKFSVSNFFPRLAAEGVEVVSVVPTLLAFLLEANAPTEGLNLRLHHIICGAGPLTVDLAMRFEDRYGIPIAHGYGLSETTCYSCCLPVESPAADHRRWMRDYGYPSIGPALPVNEMAIHDLEGHPLPEGERGEIVIRGHNVMMEYYANEKANQSAFEFGWFRSGDEGFWLPGPEGEPYYFITGRLKELIIRGGVNIAPLEIDEVLMAIPGIRAGIAVGFPHDVYGEEVGAFVQLEPGASLTAEQIIAACREKLPFQKCPKVVKFGDAMPVTSTGKYQRNKLKALFEEHRGERFRL